MSMVTFIIIYWSNAHATDPRPVCCVYLMIMKMGFYCNLLHTNCPKIFPLCLRYCTGHIFTNLVGNLVTFTTYLIDLFLLLGSCSILGPRLPHLEPRIPLHTLASCTYMGPSTYIQYLNKSLGKVRLHGCHLCILLVL